MTASHRTTTVRTRSGDLEDIPALLEFWAAARGVGRLLVRAAEEHLRELGAIRFDAMVLSGNTLGEAAWEALCYRSQEEWARWVRFA